MIRFYFIKLRLNVYLVTAGIRDIEHVNDVNALESWTSHPYRTVWTSTARGLRFDIRGRTCVNHNWIWRGRWYSKEPNGHTAWITLTWADRIKDNSQWWTTVTLQLSGGLILLVGDRGGLVLLWQPWSTVTVVNPQQRLRYRGVQLYKTTARHPKRGVVKPKEHHESLTLS